ncbi:MAG: hypothetical protein NWS83_02760, partial [Burkholderiaceae bacterium]|nr:hypothetical protein [Burkholderiaceae bacterium]
AAQAPTFRPHSTAQADVGQVLALPLVEPASGAHDAQDSADAASDWRDSLLTPKLVLEDKRAALETRQAAQWVARQIEQGVCAKDIMVIARTNARLGLMQASLATLGIPCAQPEKTTLIDSPAVADVVALLDALISPANNLALATALRSPLFGATDAQLLAIASHVVESSFNGARSDGQTQETHTASHSSRAVDATHASNVVDTGLAKPRARNWREALQHLAEQDSSEPAYAGWAASLTLMTQWLQQQPLVQLITRIYDHCNVYQAYAGAMPAAMVGAAHAQLTALLDESLALNQGRFVTPYQFVRAVKSAHHKRAWPTPADAVRLLTVHGAKGLEAHHVLLLDTHAPAQKAQSMSMLVDWPSEAPVPKRVVFVAKETSPPVCAQALLASDQAARRVEENNALYVAMTRAVQQLVVSGHTRSGNKDESWWSRLERCAQPRVLSSDALGAAAQVASPPVAEVHIKRLPRWTAQRVFAPAPAPAPASTFTTTSVDVGKSAGADSHAAQAGDLTARLGQAMHQLLEWLPATVETGADLWTPEQLKQVASNWQL